MLLALALMPLSACVVETPERVVACPVVRDIDEFTLARIARELDELPADSLIASLVVPNWVEHRDAARACRRTDAVAGALLGRRSLASAARRDPDAGSSNDKPTAQWRTDPTSRADRDERL